jgi:hypothetical protein
MRSMLFFDGRCPNRARPVLDLGADQRRVDRNAEFAADMLRHTLVVAAENRDADTLGPKRGSSAP